MFITYIFNSSLKSFWLIVRFLLTREIHVTLQSKQIDKVLFERVGLHYCVILIVVEMEFQGFLWIGEPLLLEQLQSESWGGLYTDHLNKKGRTTLSLKRHIKNNSIKDFTSDHFDRKRKSQKVVDNNVNHPDTQILNARGQIYKDILT